MLKPASSFLNHRLHSRLPCLLILALLVLESALFGTHVSTVVSAHKPGEQARQNEDHKPHFRTSFRSVSLFSNITEPPIQSSNQPTTLPEYERALRVGRQSRDGKREIDALNGLSKAHLDVGDNKAALKYANAALSSSQSMKYVRGEADALFNLGEVTYAIGDLRKALRIYQQSLLLWRSLRELKEEAQTLLASGYAYADLVETNEAFDAYRQSLALCSSINDMQCKANALVAMGHLHNKLGDRQQALDLYNAALPILREKPDTIAEAMALTGFGFVYDKMGDSQGAIIYFESARKIYQTRKNRDGEASILLRMGEAYFTLGDLTQAQAHYQQSLKIFRALGNQRNQSYCLRNIGAVFEATGKLQEALAYYQQSLRLLPAREDRRSESLTLNCIGHVYETLGAKEKALGYYQKALTLNRDTRDSWAESQTLYRLAHAERALNQLAEAKTNIEGSLKVVESLRTKVASYDLRASYFATIRQYYELHMDILMQMHKENPTAGYSAMALQVSEMSRARSLLDILSLGNESVEQTIDPELGRREKEIRQALSAKDEGRMQLLGGTGSNEEEIAVLTQEIERLALEYDEVKTKIRETNPRHAALIEPQALSVPEMQALLDPNTVMLEYALGEERSYLWVLSSDGLESYQLATRKEIEDVIVEVRKALLARQPLPNESLAARLQRIKLADEQFREQAAILTGLVLAPGVSKIGNKRLLIIPDAALQYVPFEALPEPGTLVEAQAPVNGVAQVTEAIPLMLGHEIVYQPSASALALILRETAHRQPAAKTIAALADPVFEQDDSRIANTNQQLTPPAVQPSNETGTRAIFDEDFSLTDGRIPRLPDTRTEVDAIFSVVPAGKSFKAIGFEADKKLATGPELGQYRIVHFATHGLLNSKRPELSSLVLSRFKKNGEAQDGFLRLSDIYNLHLPVELVVLSACNTGLGKDIKGEGLVGLTRGFMYAGAPRVLASLWKVDDEATAELMKHFYRGLLQENLPPAAALRQAQIALLRENRWHAPYFWAAFVLQGEYKQPIPAAPNDSRRLTIVIFLIVGFLIAISVAGHYAARYRRSRTTRADASGH